jgi:hypothetical protein
MVNKVTAKKLGKVFVANKVDTTVDGVRNVFNKFSMKDVEFRELAPGTYAELKLIGTITNGIMNIKVDLKDVEACREAVDNLCNLIWDSHGVVAVNEIMAGMLFSKSDVKVLKNVQLLKEAHGRDVEEVARELAERNRSLPKQLKYGPSGTERPATMATHIRRLQDRFGDPRRLLAAVRKRRADKRRPIKSSYISK